MLVKTIGEAIFLNLIVNGLARGVSKLKAQQEWIPANFVPASRPYWSSLYGLKHQFENGTHYYLHEDEMAEAFRANGIRVEGEKVYAKRRFRGVPRIGVRYLARVVASASLAIHKGMVPAAVLASLTRNAGYLFDANVASRRRDSEAFRLTPRRRLCGNRRFERCTI